MIEISLNQHLADILKQHGITITIDDEFIHANLSSKIKLKARAVYSQINNYISSQMDVMLISDNGEKILECFGDFGDDVESAIQRNLMNFAMSSLHVVLATFGSDSQELSNQITIEEWKIDNKVWTAYIGNLVPKTDSQKPESIKPPEQFFKAIETGIFAQSLNNDLHWFRGYYLQYNDEIKSSEFLMDNVDITSNNPQFSSIPVIPDTTYYSCRNFIILRRKS